MTADGKYEPLDMYCNEWVGSFPMGYPCGASPNQPCKSMGEGEFHPYRVVMAAFKNGERKGEPPTRAAFDAAVKNLIP